MTVTAEARPWTAAQTDAITAVGVSLLVSAAAGSGKTSVLAERCVRLVCDGPDRCGVNELLVVTFTEAAATEMKGRVAKGLAGRAAADPGDEHVARQLALLERANIGTLHAFCSRLLRQHFERLGLDPNFRILDADEVDLMKREVARDLLDDWYDRPDDRGGDAFRLTVDLYADGQDERLVDHVVRVYETLCSVPDPAEWMRAAAARVAEGAARPLAESELGRRLIVDVRRDVDAVRRDLAAAAATVKRLGGFDAYLQHLRGLYATTNHWVAVLDAHGWDALVEEAASVEVPKLKPVASTVPNKAEAKAAVDAANRAVKDGPWRQRLRFTERQWRDGLAATRPHVDLLTAVVAEFSQDYAEAKDAAGGLDFADLELLTLRALRDPALAAVYHRQFRHVLVDEYQDINAVQDAILSLVSHEAAVAAGGDLTPNLFCVGDVKQSVYRFRLADPRQFLARRAAYGTPGGHGRVIDLSANFRSRGPLLDAVNAVFERTMTAAAVDVEYDGAQRLVPGRAFPPPGDAPTFAGGPIELHVLPSRPAAGAGDAGEAADDDGEAEMDRTDREAVLVGRRILEIVGRGGRPATNVVGADGGLRPARFGDVVLLLRSMRYKGDQFAAGLRGLGVPVHAESTTGYFEATEVNDVLSVLQVLDNAKQDVPLAAVLRSPIVGMTEASLAEVALAYAGATPAVPFHDAVARYARDRHDDLAGRLRGVLRRFDDWRQYARQRPVADLLWHLYDTTGYLAFCAGLPNGEQRQANLVELHDRATQFAAFRRQGLGQFLRFLEKLREQSDLGQASVAGEAEDVVRVMTIHRSKGLEFPVVFVPDLGKRINLKDGDGPILLDREAGLGLQVVDEARQVRYPSLAWAIVRQRLRQQALAEELRVLYVALTRAKEHLVLVGTCDEKRPDQWREQWAGHDGPMPTEAILSAGTPLDWLGPVAAMTAGATPPAVETHVHSADEVAAWRTAAPGRAEPLTPGQVRLAELKPLPDPPAASAAADEIIARIGREYEQQAMTRREAVVAVTALTKSGLAPVVSVEATTAGATPGEVATGGAAAERALAKPSFLTVEMPTAADRGSATHLVLQHLDVAGGDVAAQVAKLVAAKRLTEGQVALADVAAVQWFLDSDVGRQARAAAGRVRREVPVTFTVGDAADPADRTMVRGRIDLLVPTAAGGWLIVDYKTDRVRPDDAEAKAAEYAGQLGHYRDAVRRITGSADVAAVVVFLSARVAVRV